MPATTDDIIDLVYRSLAGPLPTGEAQVLTDWLAASAERQAWYNELRDTDLLARALQQRSPGLDDNVRAALVARIEAATGVQLSPSPAIVTHRVHFLKRSWWKYAAAIVLICGTVAYLWNTQKEKPSVVRTNQSVPVNNDVPAPTLNRATLTLANGQKIFVDSAASGTLAMQGNVTIEKKDNGEISYSGETANGPMKYNTLSVPRGSQVASIVLSDGTKVFLNAASSLRYPVAFTGNERRVEITGEAYFEVAKNPSRKFIVSSGDIETEVLGTHFNVNTYQDENDIRVTLLEGAVKVSNDHTSSTLKPGQQARVEKNGTIHLTKRADLEGVMAWKNGRFSFENSSVENIMRQVSRWYDVEIVYEGSVPDELFVGGTSRQDNISALLAVLEATDKIHFRLEGKKVIVTQ